jgi:hypothetical protein
VDLTMHALGEQGFTSKVNRASGDGLCVNRAVLKAVLQPPSTIFTVSFPDGTAGEISYLWQGLIGCGTFAPFAQRPADFRNGDSQASWTHPNAPDPSLAKSDHDGDGVPDYCPHTDVLNFTHPGTISVMIQLRIGDGPSTYYAYALCTYSGSLSGTGKCQGQEAPN